MIAIEDSRPKGGRPLGEWGRIVQDLLDAEAAGKRCHVIEERKLTLSQRNRIRCAAAYRKRAIHISTSPIGCRIWLGEHKPTKN